ncbi:MAG: cytochrome c biogenesis CcdA family protein [Actinobacteria bacterium]|nr:cytochrome c biogenesis CcdA family protein [Actinomycetota bacterium]
MITHFLERLVEHGDLGFGLSFLGGFLAFFSPCIIPLIPIYFSFITDKSLDTLEQTRWALIKETIIFIVGFSFIFITLGASATSLGTFILKNLTIFRILGGVFILFLAVNILGLVKFSVKLKVPHLNMRKKIPFIGSFIFGIVLGITWLPCIGPVLAAILTLAAFAKTVKTGIILLTFFSLGLAVPFLILGFSFSKFKKWQEFLKKHYKKIQYVTGIFLLIFGYLLLNGSVLYNVIYPRLIQWSYKL